MRDRNQLKIFSSKYAPTTTLVKKNCLSSQTQNQWINFVWMENDTALYGYKLSVEEERKTTFIHPRKKFQ